MDKKESSSDQVRRKSAPGKGLSRGAIDFRATSPLGITRNPEAGGLASTGEGVLDFLLPSPFKDFIPGIGMMTIRNHGLAAWMIR